MNLPGRDEGDHLCLGALVAAEAHKMLACAPYLGPHTDMLPLEYRLGQLEEGVWRWLRSGWTRVRDDGMLVHWHPGAEDYVPFTQALHDHYTSTWADMRHWLTHVHEQRHG